MTETILHFGNKHTESREHASRSSTAIARKIRNNEKKKQKKQESKKTEKVDGMITLLATFLKVWNLQE